MPSSPQICKLSKTSLFRQSLHLYWFFCEPAPLKVRLFSEPPKYQSFPPLTPSYLLKVTEFFVKISQFECLVIMTEKNIFVYKIFLFFYVKIAPPLPLKKSHSPLSKQSPFKSWGPVKPTSPFWKFGWRFKPLPPTEIGIWERGGEHYVLPVLKWIMAPKRAKCAYFSKSKFVALEQKLMQFAQYQHTGVQTWHCGYQTYKVQYEYKKSVDIGFWVTWRADS